MRIFLLGYMGVGKSTLGRMVAERLLMEFLDFDALLEEYQQMTITEIFTNLGEPFFRKLEHDLLREVIQTRDQFIMGTGGGLPCFHNNLELMNTYGHTIYLRSSAAAIAERLIQSTGSRPLIANKSKEELLDFVTQMLKTREVYYNQAKTTVDLDLTLSKEENADRLLSAVMQVLQ